MIVFPRPHLWMPRSTKLLMAPPWDEEADRALEYTDNISCGMPAGFVPCAGTATHLLDPNNLSTANWFESNLTRSFTATDPNMVLNNATDLTANAAGVAYSNYIKSSVGQNFTLSGTCAFSAYFKSIAGPPWLRIVVYDGSANYFGVFFNIATAAVGLTTLSGGNCTLTCTGATPAGNGYTQISFAGNVSPSTSGLWLEMDFVDGDGTGNTTLNQEFYAWQVSP